MMRSGVAGATLPKRIGNLLKLNDSDLGMIEYDRGSTKRDNVVVKKM
jgi:hypothetical protein